MSGDNRMVKAMDTYGQVAMVFYHYNDAIDYIQRYIFKRKTRSSIRNMLFAKAKAGKCLLTNNYAFFFDGATFPPQSWMEQSKHDGCQINMSVEDVLQMVRDRADLPLKGKRENVEGVDVYLTSLRLRTFALKGVTCAECGLKGTYFKKTAVLNEEKSEIVYHLNLYGRGTHGKERLFTKDHIHPKSAGGKDKLENMQTMCEKCNRAKGAKIPCKEVAVTV